MTNLDIYHLKVCLWRSEGKLYLIGQEKLRPNLILVIVIVSKQTDSLWNLFVETPCQLTSACKKHEPRRSGLESHLGTTVSPIQRAIFLVRFGQILSQSFFIGGHSVNIDGRSLNRRGRIGFCSIQVSLVTLLKHQRTGVASQMDLEATSLVIHLGTSWVGAGKMAHFSEVSPVV